MSDQIAPPPQFEGSPYGAQQRVVMQPAKTSALAVISLILGILIPLGGIILGPVAMRHTRRTGMAGHRLAKAGFVIGLCLFIFWLVVGLFVTWYFGGFVYGCQTVGVGCPLPVPPTFG